jgi:hypothetical protein
MNERDTLIPCQACGGEGSRLLEYDNGSYRRISCNWCDRGFTDKETAGMLRRWQRILKANHYR